MGIGKIRPGFFCKIATSCAAAMLLLVSCSQQANTDSSQTSSEPRVEDISTPNTISTPLVATPTSLPVPTSEFSESSAENSEDPQSPDKVEIIEYKNLEELVVIIDNNDYGEGDHCNLASNVTFGSDGSVTISVKILDEPTVCGDSPDPKKYSTGTVFFEKIGLPPGGVLEFDFRSTLPKDGSVHFGSMWLGGWQAGEDGQRQKWPLGGELDIAEFYNGQWAFTLHYVKPDGTSAKIKQVATLPDSFDHEGYNTWSAYWDEPNKKIIFFINGELAGELDYSDANIKKPDPYDPYEPIDDQKVNIHGVTGKGEIISGSRSMAFIPKNNTPKTATGGNLGEITTRNVKIYYDLPPHLKLNGDESSLGTYESSAGLIIDGTEATRNHFSSVRPTGKVLGDNGIMYRFRTDGDVVASSPIKLRPALTN